MPAIWISLWGFIDRYDRHDLAFAHGGSPQVTAWVARSGLELFPEGLYRFKGTTTEGKRLRGKARLSHAIPDAPVQISPLEDDEINPDNAVFTWADDGFDRLVVLRP